MISYEAYFVWAFIFVLTIYGVWLIRIIRSWKTNQVIQEIDHQSNFLSVIVPFRNEANHLNRLIENLSNQTYSNNNYEVILVNDHSTDEFELRKALPSNFKLVHSSKEGKKNALSYGIELAKANVIVTTDADCEHQSDWLKTIDSVYASSNLKMIIGPVFIRESHSIVNSILSVEFTSLQSITGGMALLNKPVVCNGANLVFDKDVFLEVNGYSGNDDLASGDDVFLMEKIKKLYPSSIGYLNSPRGVVYTDIPTTVSEFVNQRIRWAKKSVRYTDKNIIGTGALILAMNLFILFAILYSMVSFDELILTLVFIKFILDGILFSYTPDWLKHKNWGWYHIPASILYPIYTFLVLILGFFITPKWKGRAL